MSYQVNINGHSDTQEDEAKALDVIRTAVENLKGVGKVYNANVSTSHHGNVNLMSEKKSES